MKKLKNKLKKALVVPVVSLLLSGFAYAGELQDSKELDIKLDFNSMQLFENPEWDFDDGLSYEEWKRINEPSQGDIIAKEVLDMKKQKSKKSKKKSYYDIFIEHYPTFEKDLREQYELEIIDEELELEAYSLMYPAYQGCIYGDDSFFGTYHDWDKETRKDIQTAMEHAFLSAVNIALEKWDFWNEMAYKLGRLTKLEFIKNKKGKDKINQPFTIKDRGYEEKLEDRIDRLDEEAAALEKRGDLEGAKKLEAEKEHLKDKLHEQRKFKVSLGFDLDLDVPSDLWKEGNITDKSKLKFKSRYFSGNLNYSFFDEKAGWDLSKDLGKTMEISLNNDYKNYETSDTIPTESQLKLEMDLREDLTFSPEYKRDWEDKENIAGFEIKKAVLKTGSISFDGEYNQTKKTYEVGVKLRFNY